MPKGPNRQKRPGDVIGAANMVAKIATGPVVTLSLEDDEVKLTSARRSVARAQALYRAHATADRSSDAFLVDRRRES